MSHEFRLVNDHVAYCPCTWTFDLTEHSSTAEAEMLINQVGWDIATTDAEIHHEVHKLYNETRNLTSSQRLAREYKRHLGDDYQPLPSDQYREWDSEVV